MKEITKEKVQQYTMYQAVDGTEFNDKTECQKYEQSAKGVIMARIAKLIVGKENAWTLLSGNDDNEVVGFKIESESDLESLKQFLLLENSWYNDNPTNRDKVFKAMEDAYNNKDIVLFGINYDGEYYWINSRQNIIDNLMNLGKEKDNA